MGDAGFAGGAGSVQRVASDQDRVRAERARLMMSVPRRNPLHV
jgi:hypothetical protein